MFKIEIIENSGSYTIWECKFNAIIEEIASRRDNGVTFCLFYIDTDNELMQISNEIDYKNAIKEAKFDNKMKIIVRVVDLSNLNPEGSFSINDINPEMLKPKRKNTAPDDELYGFIDTNSTENDISNLSDQFHTLSIKKCESHDPYSREKNANNIDEEKGRK